MNFDSKVARVGRSYPRFPAPATPRARRSRRAAKRYGIAAAVVVGVCIVGVAGWLFSR
jgi:hypothetical protein